jgi:hypothetical protein
VPQPNPTTPEKATPPVPPPGVGAPETELVPLDELDETSGPDEDSDDDDGGVDASIVGGVALVLLTAGGGAWMLRRQGRSV